MLRHLSISFFILFTAGLSNLCAARSKTIDSLQTLLLSDKTDTVKVTHLNKLSSEYRTIGNYAAALQYATAALQLARQLKFEKGILSSYNRIGTIHGQQGNYEKALENYLAALKIAEKTGSTVAGIYGNIGNIYYFYQKNNDKALENYLASLKADKERGNKRGMAYSYNNVGLIYHEQGNYDKALENYLAALKLAEEIDDKMCRAGAYLNIGDIYVIKNKADLALNKYSSAMALFEALGHKYGIANADVCIGKVYMSKLNYHEAEAWLQKGLRMAKELNAIPLLRDAYKGLSEANEKMNDYRDAYTYHRLYSQFKDSIFNEKSNRQIAEMQTKYETGKKEKENQLLVQQNLLQQAEIKNRTLVSILFAGLVVFTISIFAFIYTRYKLKQKALMKQELNSQQQLRFKAIIDAEEKERTRVARELHDGLGQLLSTAKLNISALEEDIPSAGSSMKNALSLIDNAIDEVRTISHNMMPGTLIRLGLISALRELARSINNSNKINVELKVDYDERLGEVNEVAIYRIVQESVNNMIRYSQGSGITIILNKRKADLFIEIKDNGIGFDTSLIKKSEGIGWKDIYARTVLLNGRIHVTSVLSKGTTITIHFPDLFFEQKNTASLENGKKV